MKRMLGLCLPLFFFLSACSLPPKSQFCSTVGSGGLPLNILVVGESWAAGGRLLPELPATLSKATHRAVTACQVGYSGADTSKQIQAFSRDYPGQSALTMFKGKRADCAIILTGVNDVTLHRGAGAYAEDLRTLSAELRGVSNRVVAMEVPQVNPNPPTGVMSQWKRSLFAVIYDNGVVDPVATYRARLHSVMPTATVISYKHFFRGYPLDKVMMKEDGIHLTDANFHRLGGYIAGELYSANLIQPASAGLSLGGGPAL